MTRTSSASNIALTMTTLAILAGCSTPREVEPGKPKPEAPTPPAELGQSMGPTRPAPVLSLNPGDLLTSTDGSPLRAWLDNGGDPVDARIIEAVANELELREYPSLKLVDVTVATFNPTSPSSPADTAKDAAHPGARTQAAKGETRAFIELTPKAALPASWYVLAVRKVPQSVRLAPWSATPPPVGEYAVRFHTGSHPVIVRALFCEKAGQYRAILELSENVRTVAGASLQSVVGVEQASRGVKCSPAVGGPLSESVRWIEQDCAGFSSADPVQLTINAGLVSFSGVPLGKFDGSMTERQTIDIASIPRTPDGCQVWRF